MRRSRRSPGCPQGDSYHPNRYYNPATGQFTQQDPIGLAGGLNLYGYADGDPVNFSDPFGLWPFMPARVNATVADAAAGVVPGVSTVLDAATVVTGKNLITGEGASRLVALAGLVTPAAGAELRGIGKVIGKLSERFGEEVAAFRKATGAVQREWVNTKTGMKHILRGPETGQIGHTGPPVRHWNYEQHVPEGGGRYKKVQNIHLDERGNPTK